jgi:hypothetical protein
MSRLHPLLARDRRKRIIDLIALYFSLVILTAIIIGVL